MLTLNFQESANNWNEATPLGNGFLGGMFYGDVRKEQIQLNEDSLWSGVFRERINPDCKIHLHEIRNLLNAGKVQKAQKLAGQSMFGTMPHMQHYETMGQLWIDFFNTPQTIVSYQDENRRVRLKTEINYTDYKRTLELTEGIGRVSYELDGSSFRREYFASFPEKVIACHLESSHHDLSFSLSLERRDIRRCYSDSAIDSIEHKGSNTLLMNGYCGGANGGIHFTAGVSVKNNGGTLRNMGSHIIVENASSATIYITGRTSFRSNNPPKWCEDILINAASISYEELKRRHIKDYQNQYQKMALYLGDKSEDVMISLPDNLKEVKAGKENEKLLEAYFHFGRYLLISSSREGSLPATLQGIWNEELYPIWGSRYTININIQMNYWMAEKCGLGNLHMPLLEHLKRMYPHGCETASKMYGARGFCCHHNTDIWGDCAPQDSSDSSTIWPIGGAWLSLHIMEHYRYTKDLSFLEEYFPILKDSVLFFIDYMVQNDQGEWVTGPSLSPENSYYSKCREIGSLCMGPSMDSQIVWTLFDDYLEAFKELTDFGCLSQNEELLELAVQVKERKDALPPIKIGRYGQIQEWAEDYEEVEPGHRHLSQLFALYPGRQIRLGKTPNLAEAAKATLQRRLTNGGGHTGWSKAWIIHFFARLGCGEEVHDNLYGLLANSTLDNLFDNHPPFQIDGNFGGANAILEMILQDYGDEVWLLPALSERFLQGGIAGIRLISGAVLDMEWSALDNITLNPNANRKADFELRIQNKRKEVHLSGGERLQISYIGGNWNEI